MLAADPELARLLTLDPYPGGDGQALDGQRRWTVRFGALLSAAAADDPRAARPPFFVPSSLIDGVRFQIGRMVSDGEGSDLLRLLPGTLEALLAYYFDAGERGRLARAVLDG